MKRLDIVWKKIKFEISGAGYAADTSDGYRAGAHHIDRGHDSYFAIVEAPDWLYTGLFETMGRAKAWARETIETDRAAPRKRSVEDR